MILSNGCIYIGSFLNDRFHGDNEQLLMPSMVIYQGKFTQGKTSPIGMLLYPDGDIYYGQHNQFVKEGIGKLIQFSGGFLEGTWEQDKLSGPNCRVYDEETGDLYVGPMEEGKRSGKGRLYDAARDEVYEGDFENNSKQGEGKVYRRNGEVLRGDFRHNSMEGTFQLLDTLSKADVERVFNNARKPSELYITVNKKAQSKVDTILSMAAPREPGLVG